MHCPASDYSRLSRKPLTALDYSRAMCLLSAPPLRIPAIFLLLRKGPIMAIQPPPASKSPRTDAYHRPRPHHRQQGTADGSPSDPMGQIPAETPPPPLDHGRYKTEIILVLPGENLDVTSGGGKDAPPQRSCRGTRLACCGKASFPATVEESQSTA